MKNVAQQLMLICVLGCASTCLAKSGLNHTFSSLPSFASFISQHNRKYIVGTSEYDMRRNLYEDRVQWIQSHNSNPHRLWNAVVNHLTDNTDAELKRLRGLRVIPAKKKMSSPAGQVSPHQHKQFLSQVKEEVLPAEVSWAHLSALQQDVNQLACGSCWAIATSTMLQAHAEIHGNPRSFSAQELVDCVPNPHNCGGSGGCDGATVELGMNWIVDQGLDTAEGTPYQAMDTTCKKQGQPVLLGEATNIDGGGNLDEMIAIGFHPAAASSPAAKFGMRGWERLNENDYEPLIRAVSQRGPVAISVSADTWNSYGGGIFDGCTPDSVVDHAVTLMGYGTDPVQMVKYWHIKNSWSNNWGEHGSIRMLRQDGNGYCGIDNKPEEGTGCDGGPPKVKVCGMCGILYDSVVPHF